MILLDTHTWLWLLHDPNQLSTPAQGIITESENNNGILISSISVWEIATKQSLNKLQLPLPIHEWFELAQQQPGTVIEPLSPSDAIDSVNLPGNFHKDPADRILVAIARRYEIPLITCDQKILSYSHVKTIW
ncbi:type II toxin-antitoxin system VapC family toxin [Synechocystis sp. PCC 7339]|uniref:type II toxin-antitoxin system VapC family toxin n=1 Tax=unclassified Synechocystis TaxID=2640012 RepID=UPI001BAF7DA5|nr:MULTISPECIES: type II toxin-antitoxin system VapC family toxin [unclassified Synechocystis]QUS61112.1 type II toxin-antitoxin system VapC family toxin [Synechocystis sp. PCC 7338]UAJ73295.1 type II toxin-antitoxin system VapC family toxin [Synechocystis sp. PCC 7339]